MIREIFSSISADTQQSNTTWIIEDIIDILNASDLKKILSTIDSRGKKDRDPFTYFYEDFLQLYDPKKREKAGVYYTPRPVVSFIVNVINQTLKDDFGKLRGFAEPNVNVLDPATGTGTFLWITYLKTFNELLDNKLNALIRPTIQNHILKDFYGFELLITPYIVAHLKLTSLLEQWRYNLPAEERIPVYLTNTLEHSENIHTLLPFMREISEESRTADRIKSRPILVILGNPPYSGMSSNKGKWIDDLLKKGYKRADGSKDLGYYFVDGKPLGEKNPKWLQDDYVKFIRFAQWKIDTAGEGILGYITNHSYLDNPTFRGMRQSLMQSFERIYILNLHGNSLKKEKCPDGSKDENVFDIQQGTAIAIFIKNKKYTDHKVYYADLYGDREFKYVWLDKLAQDAPNWQKTINWQELLAKGPYYYFVPRDYSLEDEYMKYAKITDIFPVNSAGIVTARDELTIKNTPEEVWTTVTNFFPMKPEEARQRYNLGEDALDWKVELAQKDLKDSGPNKKNVVKVLHKPFDTRYTYYTGNSRGFHCRPRDEVMRNLVSGGNLAIITTRQTKEEWAALITDTIITHKALTAYDIGSLFPLYLSDGQGGRKPNLDPKLFEKLKKKYSEKLSPEDVFYYIYAVFHSVKYKDRYVDALKSDFPRIPFVADYISFKRLSALGKELADLHLLKKQLPTTTRFQVAGTNMVESVKYVDGKVYINKDQFFDGIPTDVWEFHIGGYQVLDKWLKERKGRDLSGELEHFLQVVEALRETIRVMKEIDLFSFLP